MLINKNITKIILILSFVIILVTCGGGSGGTPDAAPEVKDGPISGIASLGPIVDGDVTAFDFSKGSRGNELNTATTKSLAGGIYTLNLKMNSAPILVCIKNGIYTEAASSTAEITFTPLDELCAVANYKQSISQKIAITFYTHLAYGYAKSLIQQSKSPVDAINEANTAISDWIQTDIITTDPIDITNARNVSTTLTSGHKYGFANAAISSLMNEMSTGAALTPFTSLTSIIMSKRTFEDVLNEGRLDGKSSSGAVVIGTVPLTTAKYRTSLANNILAVAGLATNQTGINNSNADLIAYRNKFNEYAGSIFSPLIITGPVISTVSPASGIEIKGAAVNVSATITDTVELKSVIFTLKDTAGTAMTPVLPTPSNLINAAIVFDTTTYADGKYSIEIVATNINDEKSTKTISNLTINNNGATSNQAPVAVADTYTITLGDPIVPFKILSNDSDPDNGPSPLSATIVAQPTKGTVSPSTTTTGFSYTPGTTMTVNASDSFSYHVSDGTAISNTVTVTITATAQANRAPTASSSSANATVGTPITINLTASDLDSDPLTVVIDSQPTGNGSVVAGANKTAVYTPGAAGNTSFTFHVEDGRGGKSTSATVSIVVAAKPNTAPVAVDDTATAQIGGPAITIDVLTNDSDAESPNSALVVTLASGGPQVGTASVINNRINFKPPLASTTVTNASSDNFNYLLTDPQGLVSQANVAVTLTAKANVIPVINTVSPASVNAVIGSTVVAANFVVSASDPDNLPNPLILKLASQPAGQATISGMTISYVAPTTSTATNDNFTIVVNDGVSDSLPYTINVTLNQPNLPPVVVADTASIQRGGKVTTISVLTNDSDPEGIPLTITSITDSLGRAITRAVISGASIVYTSPIVTDVATKVLWQNDDKLKYCVTDGNTNVCGDISIKFINSPPVANSDTAGPFAVPGPVNINVVDNDTDPDGDPIYVKSYINPTGVPTGATVTIDLRTVIVNGTTYTTGFNFSSTHPGTYVIRYIPWDGQLGGTPTANETTATFILQ